MRRASPASSLWRRSRRCRSSAGGGIASSWSGRTSAGPIACLLAATGLTVFDQSYICSDSVWTSGDCTWSDESGTYQLFILLPIIIILLEWACSELSVLQGGGGRQGRDEIGSQQAARTLALVFFALVALPFRAALWRTQDFGLENLKGHYNARTNAFEAGPTNETACCGGGVCNPSDWQGYDGETCGECSALVKVRDHGGTCAAFCALQGHGLSLIHI